MKKYEKTLVGVDPVIFTIIDEKLYVYLERREKKPFKNFLELPGGLIFPDETCEDTIKRKLSQYFGKTQIYLNQFHVFSDPKRDPRERTISVGFLALVNSQKISSKSNWHITEEIKNLAFDHLHIIKKAKEYLKQNTSPNIIKQFLPEKFPINTLQKIYEIIEETTYDNRNFRKQILNSDLLEDTNKLEENVSHRPAKLYKFKNKNQNL